MKTKWFTFCSVLLFCSSLSKTLYSQQCKLARVITNRKLVQNIRIAVMATGEFDHCGFGIPRWHSKKWLPIKVAAANSFKYRRRKCCIEIISASDSSRKTIMHFWIEASKSLNTEEVWQISGCQIIY